MCDLVLWVSRVSKLYPWCPGTDFFQLLPLLLIPKLSSSVHVARHSLSSLSVTAAVYSTAARGSFCPWILLPKGELFWSVSQLTSQCPLQQPPLLMLPGCPDTLASAPRLGCSFWLFLTFSICPTTLSRVLSSGACEVRQI